MGKPEQPAEYVRFQDGDVEIYLARDIVDKLEPGAEKLLFAVQDYGRFWLWFDGAEQHVQREQRD